MEGFRITVGAKPLHVIDETFCLVPTDGANCDYQVRLILGASTEQRNLQKRGSSDNMLATSPMMKSVKGWRK